MWLRDRTINHDTAWYLISTRKWLDGARLYGDIYEVNPPLNSYFTVPVLLLGDALSIGDANGQYLVVSALTFVSLIWSSAILNGRLALSPHRRILVPAGLAAVLTLPALAQIAQREHVLLLLVLSWFLGHVPGGTNRPAGRVVRAAVAAAGICLKPYFLTLPLAVTLWQIARQRSLRPVLSLENMVMLALGIGYLLAVRALHPEYFRDIVPAARLVYTSFGSPADFVLGRLAISLAPFLPFCALLAIGGRGVPAAGLFCLRHVRGTGELPAAVERFRLPSDSVRGLRPADRRLDSAHGKAPDAPRHRGGADVRGGRDDRIGTWRTQLTNLYQKSTPKSTVGGINYSNTDNNVESIDGATRIALSA